jgi:hypothetical protein
MKKQQGTYYSRRRAEEEEQLPWVCKMRGSSLSLSLPLSLYRATGSSPAAHSSKSVSCSNLLFSFSVWDPDPHCLETPPLPLFVFSSLLTTYLLVSCVFILLGSCVFVLLVSYVFVLLVS